MNNVIDINLFSEKIKIHKNKNGWSLWVGSSNGYYNLGKKCYDYKVYKFNRLKLNFNPITKKEKLYRLDINKWETEIKIFGIFSVYIYSIFGSPKKIKLFKIDKPKYLPIPKGKL